MSLDIVHDFTAPAARLPGVRLGLEAAVGVGARGFVAGADVDVVLEQGGVALPDGAAVDHDEGAVMARGGHDDAGHVLVASRDGDVGVVVLGAGDGLNGVGDEFAGLEGEAHTLSFVISAGLG
ncbi:hypothetical protein G7046_g10177 [Stylonectria norvegica]|nr:hypothetical protein G7046_g10177 [Stylonectria norvegica]